MAAPWGDSRYSPFPTPFIPSTQPANARQQQQHGRPYRVPQVAPGFYNPAIFPNQPYGPPVPAVQPMPQIPSILRPGRGPQSPPLTGHRSYSKELSGDIFFGAPAFPQPQIHPPSAQAYPPHPPSHHVVPPPIRHTVSAPATPIPQKPDFDIPPLPPKPLHTSPPQSGRDYLHAGSHAQ